MRRITECAMQQQGEDSTCTGGGVMTSHSTSTWLPARKGSGYTARGCRYSIDTLPAPQPACMQREASW